MSYNKTTWETGDIITAEKLNNIEGGVESANGEYVFDLTDIIPIINIGYWMTLAAGSPGTFITGEYSGETEEEVAAMWNVVQNIDAGKTVKFALSIDGGSVKTYYTINQIYTIHDSESGEDNAIGFSAYLNANQSGGLLSVELNVTLNNSKVDSIATVCVHSENIND